MPEISQQEIQTARYARQVASAYYLNKSRVSLIDIGWKIEKGEVKKNKLAVRVHVRDKPRERDELESLKKRGEFIDPERIPFRLDLVEADYQLQWWWDGSQQLSPRRGIRNPILGGISVSGEWLFGSGTLGGVVEDKESGDPLILSNWHVLAGSAYAPKGLNVFQPGYGDGGNYLNTIAHLERHAMNEGIDAAVAKLNQSRQWSIEQDEVGLVTGSSNPTLDMPVIKSGRTTAVTCGIVDGIDGEYQIRYAGMFRSIKHVNRIIPQPDEENVSAKGDSGSWWLEEESKKAVALHFAGKNFPDTALAISMPEVLDALNIKIITTADVTPTEISRELEEIGVSPY